MSLRKNTLNKIKNNIKRARRLGTIDPKTKLEDLGEAIRKDVRMKERERIPDITREKMKKAQEKRDRKKSKELNKYISNWCDSNEPTIPTAGRDEGSKSEGSQDIYICPTCHSKGFYRSVLKDRCSFCDGTEGGNPPEFDPNGIKNDSSK